MQGRAVRSFFVRLIALFCALWLLTAPAMAQVVLTPSNIPDPIVGAPYSQSFFPLGGTPPYILSLAGPLPAGLHFSSGSLLGTPTESGMFSFSVLVSDAANAVDTQSYTINVAPPTISLAPASLSTGTVGTSYSLNLSALGGTAPYSFSASGTLPAGITLSSTGLLSGTPLAAGSYIFTVSVTDSTTGSGPYAASAQYTLVIDPPSLTLSPTLPNTAVGQVYAETILASGGAAPYTFRLASGALPIGLTLGADGSISGTGLADGTFTFTISAEDSTGGTPITGSQVYSLSVAPPTITLSPANLPNGRAGTPYSGFIAAGGGISPYSYAATGSLPPGLTLSASGLLSGTPTETDSFSFSVTATDSSGGTGPHTGTQTYSLIIQNPHFTLQPSSLPPAVAGQPYSQTVVAGGGTAPYTYSIMAGALPAGLTFSAGTISGIPTVSGSFFVTIRAQDSTTGPGAPYAVARYYPLTVAAPLVITPASLPTANAGSFYSQTLTASGGVAPYSFNLASGALPAGLTLGTDGSISGTTLEDGTFTFTVSAEDSTGGTPIAGSQVYSLSVAPPTITLSPASLPDGLAGASYSASISASGGTAPYSYAVTSALPAGLTLSASGLLSGTPIETGSFSFSVTATDSSGGTGAHTGTQVHSLVIQSPNFTLQPSSLPPAITGQPYSQTIVAGGGTAPYTYSIMAGALPAGLTFSAGTISGIPTATGQFFVTIRAQDSTIGPGAPYAVARYYPLAVVTPTIVINPTSLPTANFRSFYSQTLTASGGVAPYSFAVSAGSLPPGLSLSSAGTLFGRPTASGTFDFSITATDGSIGVGPFSATQAYSLTVAATGRLAIEVRSNVDGTYGFTSSEPLLNALSVGTTGGIGRSASIELPAGTFNLAADDLSGAGTALTDIDCDDSDSSGDITLRTATIVIDASESLTCVFTFLGSREQTTALIEDFLKTRASMILADQPHAQRRIDRLNGIAPKADAGSTLMSYLPAIAGGNALQSSISLNAIEGAAGNENPSRFDIWMEGTFMRLDAATDSRLLLGSVGADYLVTPDLLIGGFVQLDHMTQGEVASGFGWIAGPYATMRLNEHLYLDLLAGFGRSSNRINPFGSYEDSFGATRWLLNAAIEGQWTSGSWTFSPRASLGYFAETSEAYLDALGIAIPPITTGVGQIAIGPAVSYRLVAPGEMILDLGLGFEGMVDFGSNLMLENGRARLKASIYTSMPSGADIGIAIGLEGIGNVDKSAVSVSGRFAVPMK